MEVARKLIERREKASPAVNRLGEKENTIAQAFHVNTVPRDAELFRESYRLAPPDREDLRFRDLCGVLAAMRPLWETSHHIS